VANGSCPRGGMRWKRFGELLKNKELCLFCFYGKETGKKEMIKREIATFRKGFGEGDLESLRVVLLFYNKKANLGSLSHYSIVHSSIKISSASK